MNIDSNRTEEFLHWFEQDFKPLIREVDGLTIPTLYEAQRAEGRIWTYLPDPRFTILFHLEGPSDVYEVVNNPAFLTAWKKSVLTWAEWTSDFRWTVYEQVSGLLAPIAYPRILLTQEDVAEAHADAWVTWYDTKHLSDAAEVPDEFGHNYRRLRSREVIGLRWHSTTQPTFAHVFEVVPDVDLAQVMSSPEFEAMAGDTMAYWSSVLSNGISTMCIRVA